MFGKEDASADELRKLLWKALDSSPFVMLGLIGVEDSRTRPMTVQIDRAEGADTTEGGALYFVASRSEHLVEGLGTSHRAVATYCSKGHDLFAHIHGTLALDDDRAVTERL